MNILQRAIRKYAKKIFDPMEGIDLDKVVGWHSVGGSNIFGYYKDKQYENGYSSISKLANGFALLEPYTIDKNGNSVASNVLDRLYTPNTDMSAYDFREALAVTTLVHDKVRLRVHHNGGTARLNADRITGFTFMEGYTENVVGGVRTYMMPNGDTLKDDEVITLKSVNPDNVTDGFSASRAARRWTRLDDYIADYQKGFFENGAVPAGQLIITAKTKADFNDIVDMLQSRHKGASKNNNITYTHRPTDPNGNPLNSQIEWIPFSVNNKELALKDLFENTNKKIDSVYGVPSEIRGFLSNSNYASVGVAEKVFVKYALDPLCMKIWSKFTHELNRITGGMGVAITYDLEIPAVADEEKVKAEARSLDATTISTLVLQGYTPESAVAYVQSGEVESLIIGKIPENDEPDVLTEDEQKDTPDQPIDIYAKQMKLDLLNIEIRQDELEAKLAKKPKKTTKKQLTDIDKELYEFKLQTIIRDQMKRQVDKAIDKIEENIKSKAYGDTSVEEDIIFTTEMAELMIPLMTIYGNRTTNTAISLILKAGLTTENVKRFEFTEAQRKEYIKYLRKIGSGYADQTAEQIRDVLGKGILESSTRAEIENELRRTILGPQNEYRVQRLARTEINLSEGIASVNAMENIQADTGYSIYKVWHTSGLDPCPFCEEMNGTEVLVDETFIPYGDSVKAGDQVFVNNWTDVDSAELHANCNCYTTYRVERG